MMASASLANPDFELKQEPLNDDEWMREGFGLDLNGETKFEAKAEFKSEPEDDYISGSDYEIDSGTDEDEEQSDNVQRRGQSEFEASGEDVEARCDGVDVRDEFRSEDGKTSREEPGNLQCKNYGVDLKSMQDGEENTDKKDAAKKKGKTRKGNKSLSTASLKGRKKAYKVTRKALMKLCDNASLSDWVGSQCTYTCFKCLKHFKSWGSLNHHLRTNLGHGPARAIEKHITKVVCYECSICQQKMLADRGFILTHIQKRHGLRLEDYAEKYRTSIGHGRYKTKQDHMDTLLAKASISKRKVGSMCLFTCNVCKDQFKSWISLKHHILEKHNGSHGMETVRDHITKAVSHKCLVCSKLILCDGYFINAHIKSHRINIADYCKKYNCSRYSIQSVWKSLVSCEENIPITNEVGNFCKFECNKCKHQENSWINFLAHLKNNKHYDANKDATEYLIEKKLHQCQICQVKVICDTYVLREHFRHSHDMSTPEYKAKIGLQNRVLDNDSFEEMLEHIPSCPPQYSDCMPSNYLPNDMTTTSIGNLCRFKCHTCNKDDFVDWALLKDHLSRSHQVNMGKAHAPECVVTARYHRCQVCGRLVLADPFFMSRHLRDVHRGLSFNSYCDLVRQQVAIDAVVLAPRNRRKIFRGLRIGIWK